MPEFRNLEFYNKYKTFVEKAKSLTSRDNVRFISTQPPIIIFAPILEKNLSDMSEFHDCVNLMNSDEKIKKHLDTLVGTRHGMGRIEAKTLLFNFLKRFIDIWMIDEKRDEKLFDKMYADMEHLFYEDTIPMTYSVPLKNFESKLALIDFGNGFQIRRFGLKEQRDFQANKDLPIDVFERHQTTHVLEMTRNEPKMIGDHDNTIEYQDPFEDIEKIFPCLRLFKDGEFGFDMYQEKCSLDLPIFGITTRDRRSQFRARTRKKYSLTSEEIPQLVKLWKQFKKFDFSDYKKLDLAIKWFNLASDQKNNEYKIINYMVAFDALMSRTSSEGSTKFKISRRVANLLEDDFTKRRDCNLKIEQMYNIRSDIVHKGESSKTSNEVIDECRDLLRRSILKIFNKSENTTYSEIIDHIDFD